MPSLPPVQVAGFDANGRGDVLGRIAGGDLYLYPGQLRSFSKPVRIGPGWDMFTEVLSPGDFTDDGKADVLGRSAVPVPRRRQGRLRRRQISVGWGSATRLFGGR